MTDETMENLSGIAKVIFDEAMEEIEEEFQDFLSEFIEEERLTNLIKTVQDNTKKEIIVIIQDNFSEKMSDVKKLILGEKIARVVTKEIKKNLQDLLANIISSSLDLVEEVRNEIIGEVFEETDL